MTPDTDTVRESAQDREYQSLVAERGALLTRLRESGTPSPADRAALAALERRIRELAATPPHGYALPKAAADLVAHAAALGWRTLVWWGTSSSDEPFVTVQVGRLLEQDAQPDHRGDRWTYRLTWHSRGCPPGRVRRFGRCLAQTPDQPWTHDGPSLKSIRQVVTDHPAPRIP
ncbi:hypothetical protein ACH4PU_01795 [Streptomyces sp. NPDC021100]|uniref:hypothetical protein n=1 Tax=Streptomyces sp. NPDC021100 TaxID=3365114 RepID=UPI00378E304E